MKKVGKGKNVAKCLGQKNTLNDTQEEKLTAVTLEKEARLYGLRDDRFVLFQYFNANGIQASFSHKKKKKKTARVCNFLSKHPGPSETVLIQRAAEFNQAKVQRFCNT